MIGAGGLSVSIIAIAVGAVLDFAFTASPTQHGWNVNTIGVILMIVGGVGAVLSLMGIAIASSRRETVVGEPHEHVVHRTDAY